MSESVKYPVFKGRLVMGSIFMINKTDHENKPLADENKHNWFMGFAVPKTEWAPIEAAMKQAAYSDASCGQALAGQAGFNWKVEDCDNPENPANLGSESRPAGHMLIKFTRYKSMGVVPLVDGNHQPILNQSAVKRGDYFWIAASTKFNGAQTVRTNAGMYQNIEGLMFAEEGEAISGEAFNATNAFAGIQGGQLANGATVQTGVVQGGTPPQPQPQPQATTPPPVVTPAHDMVGVTTPPAPGNATPPPTPPVPAAEKTYTVNGQVFTESVLRESGYTDAHLAAL